MNLAGIGDTVANHTIMRVSTRGVALYIQSGTHLIADIAGWYLGTATTPTTPPPVNKSNQPSPAIYLNIPSLNIAWMGITSSTNPDHVADQGRAAAFSGLADAGEPGNVMLFAHRTTHGRPFRYIDTLPAGERFNLVASNGLTYWYEVVRVDFTSPTFNAIQEMADRIGPATVQLVACHPPGSATYRVVTTARLVAVT